MIGYIKKFIWLVLIVLSASIIFILLSGTLGNVAGIFRNTYYFRYFLSFGCTIAIILPFVKKYKCQNKEKRNAYFKAKEQQKSKFFIAIKSSDFRQEIVAFLVFITPFIISNLLAESVSIFETIFVCFFTITILSGIYSLLSLFVLILVYRSWEKN